MDFIRETVSGDGNDGQDAAYGCIFCQTGKEKSVARSVEKNYPTVRAFSPEKSIRRRSGGRFTEEERILFPGYVFFRANACFPAERIGDMAGVLRVLRGQDSGWALQGEDRAFAEWLFRFDGRIGFSKAWFEGEKIRILQGPMKGFEGKIVRVNKRHQNAMIKVRLDTREIDVGLGSDLIGPAAEQN